MTFGTLTVDKKTSVVLVAGFLGMLGWHRSLSVIQVKARNGTERNWVFLTTAAAEEGAFPLGTHLAAVCLLLLVRKSGSLQQACLPTSPSHCNRPCYRLPFL